MTREVLVWSAVLGVGIVLTLAQRLGKTPAVGRVVEHETHDDTGTKYYTAVLEYRGADGVVRRVKDDRAFGDPLPLDSTMPMLVHRRDPARAAVLRNTLGPVPDWLVFVVAPAVALAVAWFRHR